MPQATDERVAQIRKWKGLNVAETSNAIEESELADVVNFDLTDGGELIKRTGFRTVHGLHKAVDTFTRADSAVTLGSTEVTSDATAHVWAVTGNPWGISSNRAYRTGATGQEQATVDVGGTFQDVSADLYPAAGDYIGIVARWVDSNNHILLQAAADGTVSLFSVVAGIYTPVAFQFTTWLSGNKFVLRVNGTNWTVYKDGIQVVQVTNSTLAVGTRVGMNIYNAVAGSRIDNFSATCYNAVDPTFGATSVRILGFFNTSSFQQFIARAGTNLYTSVDGTTWTLIAGGPWGNIEHGVQYVDKFYMVRRDDTIVQWDGTTATAIAGSPFGSTCRVFKDRLFVANSYASGVTASRMYFSNPFDFTSSGWPATNYTSHGEGDGDVIVAIMNVQDYLIIFKTGKMFLLFVQGSDTLAWINRPFNSEIGCVSRHTIVLHENLIFFLSAKGVYQTDGNTVRTISQPVAPIFDQIVVSSATINASSAFIWQDRYVLALETFPVAPTWNSWSTLTWNQLASTPWSGSGATYTYLVYHIRQKGWTKWQPISGMAPHTFVSVLLSSAIKGVYGGDRSLNGKVYKYGEAIYQDDSINYEVAAEIKELDFGLPTERKRGKWLGIEMRGAGDFTVYHVVDGETIATITKTAALTHEEQKVAGPGYFRSWRTRFSAIHGNPVALFGYAIHMSKRRHIEQAV